MLQRIPPYRDPLVQLLADALIRGLEIYRKNATSDVLVEFECRLGTYSASRHNFTHPFATNTQTPAVLDTAASAAPFHFFSGVSQATFHALHEKLKKTAPAACVPSRSTATLFVHTAGTQRLEYAMNASCSEGQLLSGSEKERLFVHDVRCPAWAADFRVCVSRETRIPVKTWDLSTWQLFTPKVSRLRQRKSVRVGALLTVDLAVVRSFTDHSRIARPLGQQLQLPLISAPYLSHDVELEVNLEALHREVRRTRLVESTVWHTAQDVLKLIQFLTVK
ncbi:hypothetical protein, conserved [Trypanosoma brucei brucei TREU927]|uniref:mRNA 5'-phosphatase n=1 Tax=Trypanosoma brucei brucei (strain 927/4 GUTat10.1) TaxID=185431 RepID=Q57UR2_TRYB2|nr:hypothetical protein, conserved [Trypanosoma brucei brucei TREU927]AAX70657.1 hypothetical protein, conserved [Trypanosoma brucei]AAZ12496.1 hypothetical protein, conserved [Trypanosoma brucei brucei TREU927]